MRRFAVRLGIIAVALPLFASTPAQAASTITFETPERTYRLNQEIATLLIRPRGIMIRYILGGQDSIPNAKFIVLPIVKRIACPLGTAQPVIVVGEIFHGVQRLVSGADQRAIEI